MKYMQILHRQEMAAVRIQSAYRMFSERKSFLMQRAAAIKIQAFVKFMPHKRRYLSMQAAAVVIQLYWGANVMMREQTDWYKTHRDSALTI